MKQTEANMMKEAEKKILVEKKQMVTFIAGNINAATERIQVALKAVIPHLDVRGTQWEEISVNQQAKREQHIGY